VSFCHPHPSYVTPRPSPPSPRRILTALPRHATSGLPRHAPPGLPRQLTLPQHISPRVSNVYPAGSLLRFSARHAALCGISNVCAALPKSSKQLRTGSRKERRHGNENVTTLARHLNDKRSIRIYLEDREATSTTTRKYAGEEHRAGHS